MASGLADLAAYEGRYQDAVQILEKGAAADAAAGKPDAAADKYAALGYAQIQRQQKTAALAAVEAARGKSKSVKIRFLTARVLVAAGELAKARAVAAELASELQSGPQMYAKLIEGEAALQGGDAKQAIKVFTEANQMLDTWIGRFELGRAYLEAGAFTEADAQFDQCTKRRGEVIELFDDNVPTYEYFPAVYYYEGRAREGMKSAGFGNFYRDYLAIRGQSSDDPLVIDIRKRLGN